MSMRDYLAKIGNETVNIVEKGRYENSQKQLISIEEDVKKAVSGTTLYTPVQGETLLTNFNRKEAVPTEIVVENTTTLAAANKLIDEGYENVLALNFASARNPGGGFLKGSSAQEESLARSSALYETLLTKPEMYRFNQQQKSGLYSDYMIYSPDVPIFRNDMGNLLDEPYPLSFITSPAVNVGYLQSSKEGIPLTKIHEVMKKRIEKILAIASEQGHEVIVLGAFGCGVFKNRPSDVARYFREILSDDQTFHQQFKKIVFAVLDSERGQPTYKAFEFACKNIKK